MKLHITSLALALLSCAPITEDQLLEEFGAGGGEGTCTGVRLPEDLPPSEINGGLPDISNIPSGLSDICLKLSVNDLMGGLGDLLDISGDILLNEECLEASTPRDMNFVLAVALRKGGIDANGHGQLMVPLKGEVKRVVEALNITKNAALLVAKVTRFQGRNLLKLVNIAKRTERDGVEYIETLAETALEKMSSSMKIDGPGLYVIYLAKKPIGFASGRVEMADAPVPGALVIGTSAPFLAFTSDTGEFTIVNLRGQTGLVAYDLETQITGEVFFPTTEDGAINPKTGAIFESPAQENSIDEVDALNLTDLVIKLTAPEGETLESNPKNLDFEVGDLSEWSPNGDVDNLSADISTLFPGTKEAHYAFVSSGEGSKDGARSALIRDIVVPQGASTMKVEYNFLSQEYPDWLNSQFNDIFAIFIAGQTQFLHKETVQSNTGKWQNYYKTIGNVNSSDAMDGEFPGRLKQRTLSFALSICAGEEIRLVFAVSDIGDRIYDSAAVINRIWFE